MQVSSEFAPLFARPRSELARRIASFVTGDTPPNFTVTDPNTGRLAAKPVNLQGLDSPDAGALLNWLLGRWAARTDTIIDGGSADPFGPYIDDDPPSQYPLRTTLTAEPDVATALNALVLYGNSRPSTDDFAAAIADLHVVQGDAPANDRRGAQFRTWEITNSAPPAGITIEYAWYKRPVFADGGIADESQIYKVAGGTTYRMSARDVGNHALVTPAVMIKDEDGAGWLYTGFEPSFLFPA
jgi:hypothetical protein